MIFDSDHAPGVRDLWTNCVTWILDQAVSCEKHLLTQADSEDPRSACAYAQADLGPSMSDKIKDSL